ncbi:NAD(P)/FAD-dependent oxidoreductase [Gracilibacillus dipsosauri]|uniref:FAD-dependent oxidoreductase n=1 Tax=Gracilibacillus dipsosauri TaxID=178340 RepID=A0A317KZL3_9BACI|nr:FAD-dependent oxidoreductase [Gracilibacillus dipsosauri]PWU67998.1 FAD-dependent oxidoreductase [Gracilibacillus dipsosauri]
MANVIVIGGGIVGLSVAYYLAKENVEVTLVDADHTGQATTAAAGIICPWVSQRRNKKWYQLAKNSASFYPTLIDELKNQGISTTGYKQTGALVIRKEEKTLQKIYEMTQQRLVDAPEIGEVTRLNVAETKQRFPLLDEKYQSIYVSGAARVNGGKLRKSLLEACMNHGVKIITGEASLVKTANHANIKVNDTLIEADQIVLANGSWFSTIVESLGLNGLIRPQKAQIVSLKWKEDDTGDWPVIMPRGTHYIVPFEHGQIAAGTTHEDDVGWDTHVTPIGLQKIFSDLREVAPALLSSALVKVNVGFRPVAPDFLPVFGRLPGYERIYAANGLGSSGLTTGPFIGRELAKMILRKDGILDAKDYPIHSIIKSSE